MIVFTLETKEVPKIAFEYIIIDFHHFKKSSFPFVDEINKESKLLPESSVWNRDFRFSW